MTNPRPIRNYPFRGKIYTAKQIDEIIESGGSFDPSNYYDKTAIDTLLAGKEDTLTAGDNITISDGVISATDTVYTAGSGISISDGVISATGGGGGGSDWELVTTYDWATNIISVDGNSNITFLKDVCLVPCVINANPILFLKDSLHKNNEKISINYIGFDNTNTSIMINNIISNITDVFNSNLNDSINNVNGIAFIKNDKTISSVTISTSTTFKKYIDENYGGYYGIKLYVRN